MADPKKVDDRTYVAALDDDTQRGRARLAHVGVRAVQPLANQGHGGRVEVLGGHVQRKRVQALLRNVLPTGAPLIIRVLVVVLLRLAAVEVAQQLARRVVLPKKDKNKNSASLSLSTHFQCIEDAPGTRP